MLPAVHTCFGRQFLSIMESGTIDVGEFDTVIKKNAAFFFYGKPSYRPRNDGRFRTDIWSALFAFVIDYSLLGCPDGILPFDSGGYERFYKNVCDNAPIEEYYLRQDKESPARVVNAFFGNNDSYYDMEIRGDLSNRISKLDFHSDSIRNICAAGATEYDHRAASIEMHYVKHITLDRNNLLAIVGPDTALEDREVEAFADALGAERVPYRLDRDNVDARQRQVRDATREWLGKSGRVY